MNTLQQLQALIDEAQALVQEDIFFEPQTEDEQGLGESIERLCAIPTEMKAITENIGINMVLVDGEVYRHLVEGK